MFEYIKGTLISISDTTATVDVNGLGYRIYIPLSISNSSLPIGDLVLFYISTVIREDSHRNFGFVSHQDRYLFEQISKVSGIGPKTALAIIGRFDYQTLLTTITTANTKLLEKIPGIGKKTAERIVIELKDSLLKKQSQSLMSSSSSTHALSLNQTSQDVLSALINLGFTINQAQQKLQKAISECNESLPHRLMSY